MHEARMSAAADLEAALRSLADAHGALLEAIEAQREAVRCADPSAVESATRAHLAALVRIEEADVARRAAVERLAGPDAASIPIATLAAGLPVPTRNALERAAAALRPLVERARRERAQLRETFASLVSHMDGLIQQVHRRLSHAGTYGRAGRVEAGRVVVSGVDVVS
ncbi:MAG: flagellar export chaperone FlgN [Phycisphaeraceae bacterium]|nr:flagellar export chaperone FlgN [Phycisphaeraceae bacterium]